MLDGIINRVGLIKNTSTKTEKMLIKFFETSEPVDIMFLSITELSELANVSEATILRFCRKLGFKGYQEFKLTIAQDSIRYNNNTTGYAASIAGNMINCINDTLSLVDYKKMEEAANIILNAKKTFVMGCGNSGVAAMEMANRLLRVGIHLNVSTDTHFQAIVTSSLSSSDALVLVSVSGSTIDILNIASIAQKNNVPIIIISNHIKSPLSKFANVILPCTRKEAPLDGGSLITKISQLFTIDVLCKTIINTLGENADVAIKKSAASISNKIV